MARARPLHLALFALLALIWGSTWLVIKTGYGDLGPFTVAAWRFLLAGVLLVPLGFALRVQWPRGRAEWRLVVGVGLALFTADYGLIYWGEQFLASGLTAVLFAVLPVLTAFAAHVYLPGERLTARKLAGTLLAFFGVAALFADQIQIDRAALFPMLAILASAAFAAASSVATKRHGGALHPVALNAPAMLVGTAGLVAVALATGEPLALPSASVWGAVAYLAIAGSVVTFLVYFHLLKAWSVTSLSFISVATPLVALVLGFMVLGERPGAWTGLGIALVLAGVATALSRARSKSPLPGAQVVRREPGE